MKPANPKIAQVRQKLIDGMISYMTCESSDPEFDAGYTEVEVNRCVAILDAYLAALRSGEAPPNAATIMELTEKTVLELNDLTDECDGCLIETDQREYLCEIISLAAQDAGLETDEDITEEWRGW